MYELQLARFQISFRSERDDALVGALGFAATMDAGATALCARMEALQHEAVSRFMACNGVNVAAAVIRLIQHPDTRLALKGEAAAAAVAIDAEASPDARESSHHAPPSCQFYLFRSLENLSLIRTVMMIFQPPDVVVMLYLGSIITRCSKMTPQPAWPF